jgi:hypothetical protein
VTRAYPRSFNLLFFLFALFLFVCFALGLIFCFAFGISCFLLPPIHAMTQHEVSR